MITTLLHPFRLLRELASVRARLDDWEKVLAVLGATCPPRLADGEQQARLALGVPALYPESLTGELPGGQEEWLAAAAAALWPEDQYVSIIQEDR